MTARAVFSEARLLKLLELARQQGLRPTTVRVERDGAIEMKFSEADAQTKVVPIDTVKWARK